MAGIIGPAHCRQGKGHGCATAIFMLGWGNTNTTHGDYMVLRRCVGVKVHNQMRCLQSNQAGWGGYSFVVLTPYLLSS